MFLVYYGFLLVDALPYINQPGLQCIETENNKFVYCKVYIDVSNQKGIETMTTDKQHTIEAANDSTKLSVAVKILQPLAKMMESAVLKEVHSVV